jgi:hypothetical protein
MTVYRMPSDRPYQRHFRIFSWTAITIMLATTVFAIYEPTDVSRSTNIALALLMAAIVIVAIFYGMVAASKDAFWKRAQTYRWELTDDKIVEDTGCKAVEIYLNQIAKLRESNGFLFIRGSDRGSGIIIPHGVDGYDEIRAQLTARFPLTPVPKSKFEPVVAMLPFVVFAALFALVAVSHEPAVVIASGLALVLLWPAWAGYALRPFWRAHSVRTRLLISFALSWLILIWVVFRAVRAVI